MTEEKIQIRHPQRKKGVAIDRTKYETMHGAIVAALGRGALTQTELVRAVRGGLKRFPGSVPWYLEWVKLDLESKKVVLRYQAGKDLKFRLSRKK